MATRKNGKGSEVSKAVSATAAAAAPSPVTDSNNVALVDKVYGGLFSFVGQSVEVHALQVALNGKRDRMTDVLLRAGMDAGTVEIFDSARDRLYANIRANKSGIASKVGAEKDAEGNYKIPKSIQVYISEVRTTLERGGSFTDKDGNVLSFGALRKANKEAREEAAKADAAKKAGPDDKARARVQQICAALVKAAEELSGARLAMLVDGLESFGSDIAAKLSETPAEAPKAAEGNAEAIAKAA